jgi:hypothetical protein
MPAPQTRPSASPSGPINGRQGRPGRSRRRRLVAAVLFAGALASPAAASELVTNGGFEHPAGLGAGWSYGVSSWLAVKDLASSAHTGDHWLSFGSPYDSDPNFIYQTLDTVVGQTYDYSFWVGGAASEPAPTNFYASIGTKVITDFANGNDFPYVQVVGQFVASSTATQLYFRGFNTLGFFKLDDVSVTGPLAIDIDGPIRGGGGAGAVPEPGTWAMLLLGLAGLGAALRGRRRGLALAG